MRTTVTIDDELYEKAPKVADSAMDKAYLFRESTRTFVRVQAAPKINDIPWQRGSLAS